MNKKKCKYCEKEFVPAHGNNGICSDECTKAARKLRNYRRYNSVSRLLPIMLANHEILLGLFEKESLNPTGEELESEGLDFSLFHRLYPDINNKRHIRLDFGTFYIDTLDDFKTFKLSKHETTSSES
jgi:hypothetical protein